MILTLLSTKLDVFLCSVFMLPAVHMLIIQPCPIEVLENTEDYNVTCSGIGFSHQVKWLLSTSTEYAAVCSYIMSSRENWSCTTNLHFFSNVFLMLDNVDVSPGAINSPIASVLTIANATRSSFADATLTCTTIIRGGPLRNTSCQVDLTYPAEVSSCNIDAVLSDVTWTVRGTCAIIKVFSSMGRYSCQLRQEKETVSGVTVVHKSTYTPTLDNSTVPYASGTCSYTAPLPTDSATYVFTVIASPGTSPTIAGTVTVAIPFKSPTISCSHDGGQYILENSILSCTCKASDLGRPQGRLIGYRDNTRLDVGNYGDASLTLTEQTIRRLDNGATFTCVLDWATPHSEDRRSDPYVVLLAYAPTITSLTLDGASSLLTVNETKDGHVMLRCSAHGRPTPDMRLLKDSQNELVRQKGGAGDIMDTVLTYQLPARCDSSARYTCVADNGMGQTAQGNVTLSVLCSPRLAAESITPLPPSVNFKGSALNVTFDVLTFPLPNRFSFIYLGRNVSSNHVRQPARVDMFEIECRHTSVYQATCVIAVDNVSEEDVGYYDAILINLVGESTFRFHVRFDETDPLDSDNESSQSLANTGLYVGVGVGVVVGVVILGLVVVAVWMQRRRLKHRHPGRTSQTTQDLFKREHPAPDAPSGSSTTALAGPYNSLNLDYVGVAAPYDVVSHDDVSHDDVSPEKSAGNDTVVQEEQSNGPYEVLAMDDVGLKSTYETIRSPQNSPDVKRAPVKTSQEC